MIIPYLIDEELREQLNQICVEKGLYSVNPLNTVETKRLDMSTSRPYTSFEVEPTVCENDLLKPSLKICFKLQKGTQDFLEKDLLIIRPLEKSNVHILGIVKSSESFGKKLIIEVLLDLPTPMCEKMAMVLKQQSKLRINKIDSLLSTLREFDGIRCLADHSLLPCILRGEFAPPRQLPDVEYGEIRRIVMKFNKFLNSSQQNALRFRV